LVFCFGLSALAQPLNDLFDNAPLLSETNLTILFSNMGATSEPGEPKHSGTTGGASVWWSWRATQAGYVTITTSGSSFDTLLAVYIGDAVDKLAEVASNDEASDMDSTSEVSFTAEAGQVYRIAVDGYYGDYGTVYWRLFYSSNESPTNDNFADATLLAGTNIVTSGSNGGATREFGEPYHNGYTGGRSVWWSWKAPFSGPVTMSTAGSTFDTVMAVYVGISLTNLSCVDSDDESGGSGTSKVQFDAMAGVTYRIAVDGYSGARGDIVLRLLLAPPPPPAPAPVWVLPDLNGIVYDSSTFTGKVVLLNFWATWCGPCRAELPDLVALHEKYQTDGLMIIGADLGEAAETIRAFLWTQVPAITYPIVRVDSKMGADYGDISAIPTTFIIDRQGYIRTKLVGGRSMEDFETYLLPLLYGDTRLSSTHTGNQLELQWPVTSVPMVLQSASTPDGTEWTDCPDDVSQVDGTNTVRVTLTGAPRFFRLLLKN
jgi:thiol-disulfide isomerase/thioredoxin